MCLSRHTLTGHACDCGTRPHAPAHEIQPSSRVVGHRESAAARGARDGERQIGTLVRRPHITSGRRASQRSMPVFDMSYTKLYYIHSILRFKHTYSILLYHTVRCASIHDRRRLRGSATERIHYAVTLCAHVQLAYLIRCSLRRRERECCCCAPRLYMGVRLPEGRLL